MLFHQSLKSAFVKSPEIYFLQLILLLIFALTLSACRLSLCTRYRLWVSGLLRLKGKTSIVCSAKCKIEVGSLAFREMMRNIAE